MPFLTQNIYGAGTLYTFTGADPTVWLLAGVNYYQTAQFNYAFLMSVADEDFIIAGSIGSRYIGIQAAGSGTTNITVTSTGYLAGDSRAINVYTDQAFYLNNAGTIESSGGNAIYTVFPAVGPMTITNSGLIRTGSRFDESIQTGQGDDTITNAGTIVGGITMRIGYDEIVNTGTIIGDVDMGDGYDKFDTHLGVFVGTVSGGDGSDTYIIAGSEKIHEDADHGLDVVYSYSDYSLGANLDQLVLEGSAHVGVGNALNNSLYGTDLGANLSGRGGDDQLVGGAGSDILYGNAGNDTLIGGDGGDLLYGGTGNDSLSVEAGDAKLYGGLGDDQLIAGVDACLLDGGGGADIAVFYAKTAAIVANLTTQTADSGDTLVGIEGLYGTNFADQLTGSAVDNVLIGLGGDDKLYGLNGNDHLEGYIGADLLDGGTGTDTAEYIYASSAVTVSLTTKTGTAGDALGDTLVSIENLTGGEFGDTLTGDGGDNVLRGGGGGDTLIGAVGVDTLYGGAGNDILTGGAGGDIFGFADVVAAAAGGWNSDTITQFQNNSDKISFVGASAIHAFSDLTISADGADTLITTGTDVIRLVNFNVPALDAPDFIFG